MTDLPDFSPKVVAELDQAAAGADAILTQMLNRFHILGISRLAAGCNTLLAMASVYSNHKDFNPEWSTT